MIRAFKLLTTITTKNGEDRLIKWYQFRVPVYNPEKVIGSIQDFKSIRFIRMVLSDFSEPIICRFATLELVRGEWRRYNLDLSEGGEYIPNDIDGLSFKNHLMIKEKIQARSLFWEYGSNYAVRKNNWKLIINKRKEKPELFDLYNDLSESKDLFNLHPELAKKLINEIENWKKNIGM